MLIRTRLRLIALLPAVFMLAIGAGLWVAWLQISQARAVAEAAERIRSAISEQNALTQEYLLYGGARLESQLYVVSGSMTKRLAGLDLEKSEDHGLLQELRQAHQELDQLLPLLIQGTGETRNLVAGALLVKTQHMRLKAQQLAQHQKQHVLQIQGRAVQLVIAALVALAGLSAVMLWLLGRRLIQGIDVLGSGVRKVTEGELQHPIVVDRTDELGMLAQAFNAMSHQLRNSISKLANEISERKRAEAELRIAAVAFESQEGMMVTDAHCIIQRVNRAFTRLTGYEPQEVIGLTPAVLKSGRQGPEFYQRLWQILKENGYWQGEIWNRRKNGKIYAEWLTISAITAPDGAITHYLGSFSEITKNKEAEAEIHRLAYYDALTHLPNRRLLLDRIGQAMAGNSRSGHYGSLLFLDLDHFKTLNDTRGHDIGDHLLIETARRVQASVREGDTVARLGGDEFVVLLEDLGEEAGEAAIQTELVGEKIRASLARPYDLEGHEFHCTVSIGVSLFRGLDESVEILLKHADLALYKAKSAGRNALRFFDPVMQTALDERSALEGDLRLALKQGQLQIFYQAQVDGARRVIGAEALLRWVHPQRGLVPPGDFIALAEETGLILPIGRWVLETACAQIKAWSAAPATCDLRLAVNVSARQFQQLEFVAEVQQVLAETGADPSRLDIELTESLVIDNVAETIVRMQALKALGVGFSVDDFGTGYSSLTYLKRLPLDQLKIDRSFVRDLATDPNDAAIVQTIITMGRILGLNVIAEGVETEAQLARLHQHGCIAYQGFLFGRPLPLEEFVKFLELNSA